MLVFGALLAIVSPTSLHVPSQAFPFLQTKVSTLAGDGVAGLRDGAAAQARFLEPFAVAFDRAGRLYVVDRAAQRIRMINKDVVTTVAGSGGIDVSGQHVNGGYADGPALSARFREPTGIAIGPDGSAYIADSGNHCIRRLHDGTVSTYAGSPSRPTAVDGTLGAAGFDDPKALSFDAAGNLYVADYRTGIRRIAIDGTVSTLPNDGIQKELTGVTAFGSNSTLKVIAADNRTLLFYSDPAKPPAIVNALEDNRDPGNPYSVAAINADQYVLSDVMHHVVELIRGPLPPYVTSWFLTELAGASRLSENMSAGFQDGLTYDAELDAPTGVAASTSGLIAIADSGNRRIRIARLPDMRMPVGNHISSFGEYPNNYKICFVASSQAHYTHWWTDSTAGQIELGLQRNWQTLQIPKKPVLLSGRIDGGSSDNEALWNWAEQYPGSGLADMVILSLSSGDLPPGDDENHVALIKKLLDLKKSLANNNVRLFVAVYPSGVEISPLEQLRVRDRRDSHTDDDMDFEVFAAKERSYEKALRTARIPYYSAYDDFVAYSKGARESPLYGVLNTHFTEFGSAYYGRLIERAMESKKPWLK